MTGDIEKDAARYRWLRDTNYELFRLGCDEGAEAGMIDIIMVSMGDGHAVGPAPKDIDDIIDAAMRKWPSNASKAH